MFQIRRRWPILTAVVALLAYGANHYKIGGIEHLRLEPRPHQPVVATGAQPTSHQSSADPSLDLTQLGIQTTPSTSAFYRPGGGELNLPAAGNEPAWEDMLSPGEKLAMWQDGLGSMEPAQPAGDALPGTGPPGDGLPGRGGSGPSLPVSTPIPLPQDFQPPTLPSSGLTAVTGNLPTTTATIPDTLGAASSPDSPLGSATPPAVAQPPEQVGTLPSGERAIRIASFNVQALGPAKRSNPHVMEILARILQHYDVVALQEIQSSRDDLLPAVVAKLNQSGRNYDYMIGPRVGRSEPRDQYAYVFDTTRLETDRYQLYTVDDPEDLMSYEPLVAWFRCKGVPVQHAFTFSLVNLRIDPSFADAERAVLPSLIEAVQQDGRQEDDWILAGDFAGGNSQIVVPHDHTIRFAVRDTPTDVSGTRMMDTIFFSSHATTEFTGRAGAFDFLRKYNLSIERAMEISNHLPVWAEFSVIEGAEPGRIAPANPESLY